MSKKLFFLISFVLVLSLAGNVLAYQVCIWDNDVGNGDQLWDNPSNWNVPGGAGPPEAPDWIALDNYCDPNNGPIINDDMNAVGMWLDYGYYASGTEVVLTMTGGTLTFGVFLQMGYYNGGTFSFDMSGGTANIPSVILGEEADYGSCILNMSGGTLNSNWIGVGTGRLLDQADINMTGGDVNVANFLDIGAFDTNTGKGHVDLHGGTLEAGSLGMGGGGEGTMDFANDGTLILDGDYRVPNGWLFDPCSSDDPCFGGTYTGTIAILADRGLITAYNTNVGDIITDSNYPSVVGLRAAINPDYDVTNPGQTTITAGAVDPNLAFDPGPLHFSGGYLKADVNLLSWVAGDNAVKHDVYLGTSFAEVNDATIPLATQSLSEVNYPVSTEWGTDYYWRIDEVNASDKPEWKGTVWHFAIIPAYATNRRPTTGAIISPFLPVLKWDPGPVVAAVGGHYVYFSTDFNDVNDRDPDPNVLTVQDTNNYAPGLLELNTTYYWAVDEFNDSEDPNVWLSSVWNFTTTDHLPVEDFNSYVNDEAMKDVWEDFFGEGGRADVYIETAAANVRRGTSMRFHYNNDKVAAETRGYSEAWALAADLWTGTDWTCSGAEALVLYFRGLATNPKPRPLYVVLSDGTNEGMVTYDDVNDTQEEFWHTWNIDLGDPCFTTGASPGPVDMSSVEKIYLGVGVRFSTVTQSTGGGEGDVYFDDIQLHPPRCLSELVVADITGDCVTNYADVDIMARDWLMYDYDVAAVPISGDPCGWWQFDDGNPSNTAVDISGYGNTGTIYNRNWVGGYGHPGEPNDPNDSALHFDGDGIAYYDRVICAERDGNGPGIYPEELMPATFTVACWVKIDSFEYFEGLLSNGTDYAADQGGFYLYASGHWGDLWPKVQNFGLCINTEKGKHFIETPDIYETDTWYHLAATYNDANMVHIYVDGYLVPCGFAWGGMPAAPVYGPTYDVGGPIQWINFNDNYPEVFSIGAFAFGDLATWYYGQGTIDEVRFYGYAMPHGEIVTLAEQGPGLYHELPSPANISDLEAKTFKKVNFRDYVILADHWLEGPILWP